jgi:hypothetical protein
LAGGVARSVGPPDSVYSGDGSGQEHGEQDHQENDHGQQHGFTFISRTEIDWDNL